MTEARLIDGLTGELIGGQSTLIGNQNTQYVNTSTYQPTTYQTTTAYQQPIYSTNVVHQAPVYTTGYATTGYATTGVSHVQAPQVVNTTYSTAQEVIKGESRI